MKCVILGAGKIARGFIPANCVTVYRENAPSGPELLGPGYWDGGMSQPELPGPELLEPSLPGPELLDNWW